jgi:hypothetical protein
MLLMEAEKEVEWYRRGWSDCIAGVLALDGTYLTIEHTVAAPNIELKGNIYWLLSLFLGFSLHPPLSSGILLHAFCPPLHGLSLPAC